MKIYKNRVVIIAADVILLGLAFYFAHLIRFEFRIPGWVLGHFFWMMGLVILVKCCCFFFFDLYRGMWRYSSLNDFFDIFKASTLGSVIAVIFVLYTTRFENVSRSVFIIDWFLTQFFTVGLRLGVRLYFEQFRHETGWQQFKNMAAIIFRKKLRPGIGTIIIGAGDCGQKICKEIRDNHSLQYNVLSFVDDDPRKIGRKIHGVPVLNTIDNIGLVADGEGANEAIIAIPSLNASRMRQIVELCKTRGIQSKTVPSMGELINGKVSVTSIRDVEYRDLLGREEIRLDQERIGEHLGRRTILVTGAGGSIGKGLCRQICHFFPEQLILVDQAESPLYDIDLELKKAFPHIRIIPVLGDIRNKNELEIIFKTYQPRMVFHAAAYKHVPMLEQYPWKAVENNIIGTRNTAIAAKKAGCEKFVLVSTDKAVNPTSVMGTSKRIAEMIVQQMNHGENLRPQFITVRFGNVIGSSGSVIPLFKKQIKGGGPVTVTHPDVIRYFMLIPEACQLILQAGAMGRGGEIFVLEMGEPVKIDAMARDLIRFSGFEPDKDIPIKYIGLRPGEKLFEELITSGENIMPTAHNKIMVLKENDNGSDDLDDYLKRVQQAAADRDDGQIRRLFKERVNAYCPNPNV